MGQSARNSAIGINGVDSSAYFKGYESSWQIGLEDSTTFAPTRKAKSWTLLLEETVVKLVGFWNATAVVGVNAVIKAALAASTKTILTVWPTGDAVGKPGIAVEADLSSRSRTFPVEGVIGLEAEFRSSAGEEDVVSHHALAQETADGTGATVDNGAATDRGGSIVLEVADVTTSIVVVFRHSDDNFSVDNDELETFATVTVDRTTERIEIAGEIKRYTRITWDLTGNATFRAALHRK